MSYGTNAPQGLQLSNQFNGDAAQILNEYPLPNAYGTSLFTGDPVQYAGDGSGTINRGAADTGWIGVFQGVKFIDATGVPRFSKYWPAGTATFNNQLPIALVSDDPDLLYDIQVSTSAGAPGPVAPVAIQDVDLNTNANISLVANAFQNLPIVYPSNPGAGSAQTGQSGYYLDYATLAAGNATHNLRVVRFTPVPGNVAGLIFNNVLVAINNHVLKGGTGTVGV